MPQARTKAPRGADPSYLFHRVARPDVGVPVADGFDYGAEVVNGAAEELRLRLARRMGVTSLLHRA
ncbi:hypothetical protein IL992_29050 [Microbispora sp. NEAU-D428]|uniref:hypothetical protein n=1 Tax=Microbispora sitophila TaxID=2771537 RepID=UPI0018694454|nr:hypothetical protein [Microbispora sitophila]MBE3013202.1 hypothetical protein [Microbispora sitophila]